MKRTETQKDKKPRHKAGDWNQVLDSRNRRVRGLWERNGQYYAQIRVPTWVGRVHLEGATNLTEAQAKWQELKTRIREGKFIPPARNLKPGEVPKTGSPASTLPEMICGYKRDRDLHKRKDPKTGKHENSSFNQWIAYAPAVQIGTIDAKFLKDFVSWRREKAAEGEKEITGRTINLNVLALRHGVEWAVVDRWLPEFPKKWTWKDLPEKPKAVRLLESQEIEVLANANRLSPVALEMLDPRVRHLRLGQDLNGQYFHDFVWLLALSGGREQETVAKCWTHVRWPRRVLFFPGKLAKAGGGVPAEDREVDFFAKLEDHLKAMFERRDKTSDYMFPSNEAHVGSYRKQWESARGRLKAWHIAKGKSEEQAAELCDDLGFHHLRHWFISQAVMAGIDYKTIAVWVSHRDAGVLIGNLCGHLRPGHSAQQAKKMDSFFGANPS